MRIRNLAQARVSYGYRRPHVLLRREGWTVNHKRHVSCRKREDRPVAIEIDESWSIDFMSDELFDGSRF